eukprot:scaffold22668_cov161-Cylindrotheca_fusiformis.AAC.5
MSQFRRFAPVFLCGAFYLLSTLWAVTMLSNHPCQQQQQRDGLSISKLEWKHPLRRSPQQLDDNNDGNNIPTTDELQREYGFSAAICVCIKDAEAYFEEWIDFHLAMQFSNIYIYDDSETFELQGWYRHTRHDPLYSRVEIIHYNRTLDEKDDDDDGSSSSSSKDGKIIQNFVYRDCVDRFGLAGPKHDYFAFIDVDEFMVLKTKKYSGILGVIRDYLLPYGGALTVNWMLIGSSNKAVYAPLPVTKRFQYRDNSTHRVIKSIAKTTDYLDHRNPHAVNVRPHGNDEPNVHTTAYPGAWHKESAGSTGASDNSGPSDIILLYHYRYTSTKEYIFKRCMRGNVDRGDIWCSESGKGIRNDGPEHIQSFPGSVFDDSAWSFLKSHVPKYKMYDRFKDYH